MISYFRHLFVDSLLGRVFAVLIFVSFVAWGVGNFVTNIGRPDATAVATIGNRTVSADDFDHEFRQQLAQVAQQTSGGDVSQIPRNERVQIALQVLQGMVNRTEAEREAQRLGVVVPDETLRQAVFASPLFKGADGKFDRSHLDQVIRANNITETKLLGLFRDDLTVNALITAISGAALAPAVVVQHAFAYSAETRTLDMVTIGFSQVPPPPAADDAALRRYFDNHPAQFQAPAYRHIKLVVLSPQTVARGLPVSEADERALFKAQNGDGSVPERRSVQVITAPSEARAKALAILWNGGAGWPQMQAAASDSVPVALDDAPQTTFPDPAMGAMAFAAKPDTVAGPTHLESGWVLIKVVHVTAATTRNFEQLRPALHDLIAASRVRDGMADRVQKLQDAIAGGSGLDQIPADIGAVAAEGTLDAEGRTMTGEPAPLPGGDALRKAIIAQAFAQKPGAPAELKQGPDDAEFALLVQSVTPAREQDYDTVKDKVRAMVQADQVRRTAEQQAAALFAQARSHGGLAALGRPDLVHVGPIGRGAPPPGVPAELARLAFSLAPGASTMVQAADGFVVATVTGVEHPDPRTNRLAYDRIQSRLNEQVGDDIKASYATALRARTRPVVNGQVLRSVVGPAGG